MYESSSKQKSLSATPIFRLADYKLLSNQGAKPYDETGLILSCMSHGQKEAYEILCHHKSFLLLVSDNNMFSMNVDAFTDELENLLDTIRNDPSLEMLLRDVWEEGSSLARVFFAHKNQLFPSIKNEGVEIKLRFLFWDNYVFSAGPEPSVMAIEYQAAQIERNHVGSKIGITMEEFFYDIRDLILYYLIRFIKVSPELIKLIDSYEFDFNKMKKVLKDYDCLSIVLEKVIRELSDIDSIEDEAVRYKLKNLAELKWLTRNLYEFIDASRGTAHSILILPLSGYEVKENLIKAQDLQTEEYTGAINQAYMIGLFDRCQSVFWCENCRDSRQVYLTLSNLDPFHVKMSCLKCGESMYAAIAYRPKPTFLKLIEYKDGILAVAIGHLLASENIKYLYSVTRKFESDFICDLEKGDVLVECKMHRTDVLDRGVRETLKKDLKQLLKHARALKEEGREVVHAISVSNYRKDIMDKIASKLLSSKEYSKEVKEYNATLISYEEAPKIIRNFK